MLREIYSKLSAGTGLTQVEMAWAMEEIVSGKMPTEDIEKFLLGLRGKGESEIEISTAAGVLASHAVKLSKAYPDLLDTCGTGGDGRSTLNVSTLSAIVACAAGARVGKHGNRAVSGKTGSADLLELLGVKIDLAPPLCERSIEETGFAFFYAPLYHPAVRQAAAARKRIPGKTLFNILGPLLNPARARRRVMGVYDPRLLGVLGHALQRNGALEALVVCGRDGLDEISLCAVTDAVYYKFIRNAAAEALAFDPKKLGFAPCRVEELVCRTPRDSRKDALGVLKGEPGPKTDWTILNAGAALWIAGKAADLKEGAEKARAAVESGAAMRKLEEIVRFTQGVAR